MLASAYTDCLFLLGGHDLEMQTIRELLSAHHIPYVDRQLRWNNAVVSQYKEDIEKFCSSHPMGRIYGIELANDLPSLPSSYQSIDHHNEFTNRPSALEQVLHLLRLPVERRHKLVAANDSHYIPGLQAAGATPEEIANIRLADRRAQGVSEEDEHLAEEAIAHRLQSRGGLQIVRAGCSSFSPICDRLYPYRSLLVYTADEWTFYGEGADRVLAMFDDDYRQGKLYCGGGSSGYVGLRRGVCTAHEVYQYVMKIANMYCYSYHIFYFPFRWSLSGDENINFSSQVDLDRVMASGDSQWKRMQLDEQVASGDGNSNPKSVEDACTLFNERQYFFDFVHPVLYDHKQKKPSLMCHYERLEPQAKDKVEYVIRIGADGSKEYVLRVDALNLNLYSTGVGILSFYLANEVEEQQCESSVRDINQFGRRVMPPNCHEFVSRNQLASSITIRGLAGEAGRYSDGFDYNAQLLPIASNASKETSQRGLFSTWQPAHFILHLIQDLNPDLKVEPVIDDRMLVNCWYANKELSQQVVNAARTGKDSFVMGDFWYKYVFVDNGKFDSCQNECMKEQLLEKSTYFRWQSCGTLYGVSRYSFVALTGTDDFARNVLAIHMRTIYARLFELVIIQRASMLRFSGEVTKVSGLAGHKRNEKEVADRINSLYKEYIRFVNQVYFRDVTAQDQGIELYKMLTAQFESDAQIKDLDGEIGELYQYITLQVDQKRNENGEWLNKLAALFLPATTLTGILGMNRYCDLYAQPDFWGHLVFISGVSWLVYILLRRKWNR